MGIMINDINDPATRFSTRLLGCKLMRRCHKEEVMVGVVGTGIDPMFISKITPTSPNY
jgi:hypothetical protein